ncbi:MAG: hypothetical protein SH848_05100 [Saprospiraceae bacterium]|nr:hypothetical protein [Saprospiraceae bacterium]MDZ4703282.1 hypothetical protein [Saprospiraceae bacterium]
MKKSTLFFTIVGLLIGSLSVGCGNTSNGKDASEEEKFVPKKEDYIGTYDIIETKHGRTFDVFVKNDTLFYFSEDIGNSVMYEEPNEVFDVPGHKTRVRFMRNKSNEIDRAIFVTKKGRYTGVKQVADSTSTTAPQ